MMMMMMMTPRACRHRRRTWDLACWSALYRFTLLCSACCCSAFFPSPQNILITNFVTISVFFCTSCILNCT